MHKVSIVTISQFTQCDFLCILAKCIKNQDYSGMIEWIIIDTSSPKNDLTNIINEFEQDPALPKIIYHKSDETTIGAWINNIASGDIIVSMDDDIYHLPKKVSHIVEKLVASNTLIIGCNQMFFYDIHFKKMYQYKNSSNNCLAFFKKYLDNYSYDEIGTEPMGQLDPEIAGLQFSHDSSKKQIIYVNHIIPPENKTIMEKNISLETFISNNEIYQDYKRLFDKLTEPQSSVYDIVYFTGHSAKWSPLQTNLGGAEQAVKHLSLEWVKKGKKVAVYGNFTWEGTHAGVDYFDYLKFKFWDKYQTLIFWRIFGCNLYLSSDLNADNIIIDIHENDSNLYNLLLINQSKIACWMIKSEFHQVLIEKTIGQKIKNCIIIPNGLQIKEFSQNTNLSRNPFRMCYCSCYGRGLHRILKNIWPLVYKLEPRAELHTYYGMDFFPEGTFKTEMKELLSQAGVMDHGRQPLDLVSREKHMSTFHLYYNNTFEIDCISIRESLVAGCIPIISNINVFDYRDGVHIEWFPDAPDFNYKLACGLVELMHNEKLQIELREKYYQSKTIISWEEIADRWLKYM